MQNYAVVRNGVVENIIVLGDLDQPVGQPGTTLVLADANAAIGSTFSGGVFARPADPPPPPAPPRRRFSPNEFLQRLTAQECRDLVELGTTGPIEARLWFAQFLAARDIAIDDPRTADGLAFLVANGKLTAARREALLQPD